MKQEGEVEIHFSRPSICPTLINVSAVEIERPHFSVFISLGWTRSCRPFNVQTHTELIEDKSRLKFRHHEKRGMSVRIPTDSPPRVGTKKREMGKFNSRQAGVLWKDASSLLPNPQSKMQSTGGLLEFLHNLILFSEYTNTMGMFLETLRLSRNRPQR